jgi:ectoine hydrolase
MVFDKGEYQERLQKIKAKMQEAGMDVLVTTNPANMNYVSGYDGYSFYVVQGVIISLDEDEPLWLGRNMDVNGAKLTTWLSEENIIGYSDDYVQSSSKHPMNFFADIILAKGWARKRIGLEMNQEFFSHRGFLELEKDLSHAVLIDASYLINWVRLIKSEKEIHYMKIAGKITERGMQAAIESIRPGQREALAAANIYHALIEGADGHAGDYPAIIPLMPSGERTSTPHLSWTDRMYDRNETVLLELSGCKHRYHAPLARTIYLGEPLPLYKDLADVVIEGLHILLDYIQPGILCEEVEQKWRQAIAKKGLAKESRLGYPIGIGFPPDWGEQTISLRPGDKTVLQPNMTIHLLPAIWLEEYGFAISESIRITNNGCETFSSFPQKLFIQ